MSGSGAEPAGSPAVVATGRVSPGRDAPAPGEAPLVAPSVAALLIRNATDPNIRDRPALRVEDRAWTHAEFGAECRRYAALLRRRLPAGVPPHVAVLADNIPEYLFTLGGAALAGAVVAGLNHTRRGPHLARDVAHTDLALVIVEGRYRDLLPADVDVPVLTVGAQLDAVLEEAAQEEAASGDDGVSSEGVVSTPAVSTDATWLLIFTSGTSSAPKAVIASHRRMLVTGNRLGMVMGLGPDDVGYVSMPLFHSNALMVGWMPSLVYGASVALARRFTASGFLGDVRRYGATYFHYTGKPLAYILATPEKSDDADNPLRIAYGNEGAPEIVDAFARRFAVEVIDAYGATEGGVGVVRGGSVKPGSLGRVSRGVGVVDEDGVDKPRARFDEHGRLANAEECVGEIVNTRGYGPFEGYYRNDEATARTTRNGWYWSGDLGYIDEDGYLYFAGRTDDWLRVDGENFPAAPVEAALVRHPDVLLATVYGVPDDEAGDQAMAALVLRGGATFDGNAFAAWLDARDDIGPKWRPRYVRVLSDPPTTGTHKIVKRTLAHEKFRADCVHGDAVFVRGRDQPGYRRFSAADEAALAGRFRVHGRARFWDL